MLNYILQNESVPDRYIIADHKKPVEITNNKLRATVFPSYEHAVKFISNQLPKRIRGVWVPVEIETVERKHFEVECSDTYGFDWFEIVDSMQNSFEALLTYKKSLTESLALINEELTDCIHACEFYKLDAAKGYKIYKMIRERRIRRRFLKDELAKIGIILGMPHADIINGRLQEKFNEIANQKYEPRVLKELFDDDKEIL